MDTIETKKRTRVRAYPAEFKAQLLGEYEIFHGDWSKLFDAPAQFERVTLADVHAVARDILDPRHRTVGMLLPMEEGEAKATDAEEPEEVSEGVEA